MDKRSLLILKLRAWSLLLNASRKELQAKLDAPIDVIALPSHQLLPEINALINQLSTLRENIAITEKQIKKIKRDISKWYCKSPKVCYKYTYKLNMTTKADRRLLIKHIAEERNVSKAVASQILYGMSRDSEKRLRKKLNGNKQATNHTNLFHNPNREGSSKVKSLLTKSNNRNG